MFRLLRPTRLLARKSELSAFQGFGCNLSRCLTTNSSSFSTSALTSVDLTKRQVVSSICHDALSLLEVRLNDFSSFTECQSRDWLKFIIDRELEMDSEITRIEDEIALSSFFMALLASQEPSSVLSNWLHRITKEAGVFLPLQLINVIFYAICKERSIDESLLFFHKIVNEFEMQPDAITLNHLLLAYSKVSLSSVQTCYNDLFLKFGLQPDTVSLNILLRAHAAFGDTAGLLQMYTKTVETNSPPLDQITIQIVTFACAKARDTSNVFNILNHFREEMRGTISAPMLGMIIVGAKQAKDLDSVERWIDFAVEDLGISLNVATMNTIIDAYSEAGNLEMMKKWFEYMTENLNLYPTDKTFCSILRAHDRLGEMSLAEEWWSRMVSEFRIIPNHILFNIMVNGFARKENGDKVMEWVSKMKKMGILPTGHTVHSALLVYSKLRDWQNIHFWLESAKEYNIELDVVLLNAVIHGFCNSGQLAPAEKWFTKLQKDGISPDNVTYSTMIEGFGKLGDKKKMLFYFAEMMKLGIQPNIFTLNCLLKGIIKSKKFTTAELHSYFSKLTTQFSVVPTTHTYHQLMFACMIKRDAPKAKLYINNIIASNLEITQQIVFFFVGAVGKHEFFNFCDANPEFKANWMFVAEDPKLSCNQRTR